MTLLQKIHMPNTNVLKLKISECDRQVIPKHSCDLQATQKEGHRVAC